MREKLKKLTESIWGIIKKLAEGIFCILMVLVMLGSCWHRNSDPAGLESNLKLGAGDEDDGDETKISDSASLWEMINSQPVYVEKVGVLDSDYSVRSVLSSVFWNISGMDIRDVKIGYLAWDVNGLPLKINDYDSSYEAICNYEGINMIDGMSYGEGTGLKVSIEKERIGTISAIVYSYTDFDENVYYNPYYEAWLSMYSGKKLNS